MYNPMTAAGDLIIGGTLGAPTKLAAGTNGYVLVMSSGSPAWTDPATIGAGNHNLFSSTHADTTGAASPVLGDIIYGNSTPKWAKLSGNTTSTNKFLAQTGNGTISAAPGWVTLVAGDLPSHTHSAADITSGTLAVARGGTGTGTYTLGDILYSDAANSLAKLAGNTTATKKFLTQTGNGSVSAAPGWNTIVSGDLPSHTHAASDITSGTLAAARGGTNLDTSGSTGVPYISSGTWSVDATALAATHGGTAQSSWTLGDILYSSASNTLAKLAGNTSATKKFLTQTGNGSVSAAPGWNTIVAGDLPSHNHAASDINSGTLATARGGFNLDVSGIAKGGLVTGTGAGTFGILTVGSDNQVLTADSSQTNGMKWATASSSSTPRMVFCVNIEDASSGAPSNNRFVRNEASAGNITYNHADAGGANSLRFIGVGANDYSQIWFRNTQWRDIGYDNNPEIQMFSMTWSRSGSSSLARAYFGMGRPFNGTTVDFNGTMHMGFYLTRNAGTETMYASNSNGTTATQTSITWADSNCRVVKNSTTNIKFYTATTLRATNTTNLPSGNEQYPFEYGVLNANSSDSTKLYTGGIVSILYDAPNS